jgi:hypothetical protein
MDQLIAPRAKAPKNVHVSNNSGNNEWYTPPEYTGSARECMGGIDLDPASCEIANRTVGATTYYTLEDDGLSKPWYGRVWLNPPYSRELVKQFCQKLIDSLPHIEAACVLVNNATETGWFQVMGRRCNGICFPRKRIKFLCPAGMRGSPLQGQVILYFGKDEKLFSSIFSKFGFVLS